MRVYRLELSCKSTQDRIARGSLWLALLLSSSLGATAQTQVGAKSQSRHASSALYSGVRLAQSQVAPRKIQQPPTEMNQNVQPGTTSTLNPQPLPPGSKSSLNPQPLPPGSKTGVCCDRDRGSPQPGPRRTQTLPPNPCKQSGAGANCR